MFIDGAEHGVIVLALGFLFNPKYVPKERMNAMMEALSRLPQRVVARLPVGSQSHLHVHRKVKLRVHLVLALDQACQLP
jgi:hypothetical protein